MTIQEYNVCVDNHADDVFRFIRKSIKDDDKAHDIVQDAFERMWVKRKTIDGKKSRSYLFTAAYHIMIDGIRKEKKMVHSNDKDWIPEASTNRQYSDIKEILNEALEKLPEIQRSVVLLRDYEGYSYQEIGDIVKLNESQVKVYIYRARTFLKNYIGSIEAVI